MNQQELVEAADKSLKTVLTKYGVKDADLAFCTAELLIVILGVLTQLEEIVKNDKNS